MKIVWVFKIGGLVFLECYAKFYKRYFFIVVMVNNIGEMIFRLCNDNVLANQKSEDFF